MKEKIHELRLNLVKSTGETAVDCMATIYVELPESYEDSPEKSYPVCYAFDGEFISKESDRVGLHDLYSKDSSLPEIIFVGISVPLVGEDRTSLLGPPINSTFLLVDQARGDVFKLPGKGDYFFFWISNKLKPFIDEHYRTKQSAADTGVMGWSSGGSGALYAAMLEHSTFTRVGSFSPATWVWDPWFYGAAANAGHVYDYVTEDGARRTFTTGTKHISHFFMYQGGDDGSAGDPVWAKNSAKAAYDFLTAYGAGYSKKMYLFYEEGKHRIDEWPPFMGHCIKTMFPDYENTCD